MTGKTSVYGFEFRRRGTLENLPLFIVAFNPVHARELAEQRLDAELGPLSYSLSPDCRLCGDRDLPHSEKLFRDIRKQREALSPPEAIIPSGKIFVFWIKKGQSRSRLTVFCRDESPATAREKAIAHVNAIPCDDAVRFELQPGVRQYEVGDFIADHLRGRADSELFSRVVGTARLEMAEFFRDEYRDRLCSWLDKQRANVEKFNFPQEQIRVPKPSPLEQLSIAMIDQHARQRREAERAEKESRELAAAV